jgi:hypothetical protein
MSVLTDLRNRGVRDVFFSDHQQERSWAAPLLAWRLLPDGGFSCLGSLRDATSQRDNLHFA